MQQQPGDGCDNVSGWRWDSRGAQHKLQFSGIKQQSSPDRVRCLLFVSMGFNEIRSLLYVISVFFSLLKVNMICLMSQWSASTYPPEAGYIGGARTTIWRYDMAYSFVLLHTNRGIDVAWDCMCLLYIQCQREEDPLDRYLMVSETSKQKQVRMCKLNI